MAEDTQLLIVGALFLAFFVWAPWYITKPWRDRAKDMRDWARSHEEYVARQGLKHRQVLATIPADHFYDPVCDAVVTPDGELVDLYRFADRTQGEKDGQTD